MPSSAKRPLKVFLCHASADKPAVRRLYRYLRSKGMDPWLDAEKLLPGEHWEVEIPKALFASDVILVCLSKNSVNKEGYVQKEIVFALDKAMEKPDGTIFIVPAKLEDCDVPHRLNRYQWVDLYRDDGRKRLMLSLNKRAEQLGPTVEQAVITDNTLEREKVEREAIEKIARENAEREAFQKRELEQAEQETREKLAREKALREKEERKPNEKSAREKPENDAAEKEVKQEKPVVPSHKASSAFEILPQEIGRDQNDNLLSDLSKKKSYTPSFKFRLFGVVFGGLLILALITWNVPKQLFSFGPANTFTPTKAITSQPTTTWTPPATITHTASPTDTPIPPTPTLHIGSTLVSNPDGATLVFVPEGKFLMGSNYEPPPESAPTYYDFRPQRPITLNAFWIDQTEVTNKQYAMCVSAGDCTLPLILKSPLRSSYYGDSQYEDYPVIYVDWFMAKAYCEWAGRRLPTEAEWEKAARGTEGSIYPWGNDMPNDTLLNYNNYWTDTTVVRQYPAGKSLYGAYDMAGNVWEWTSSLYMPYPYDATDGREDVSAKRERVLRGGSWYFDKSNSISIFRWGVAPADFLVRSDVRSWSIPSFSSGRNIPYGAGTLGFRCAMDATR